MTNFDQFLSRAGESMQESAIRKMGAMLAGAPDMVSFAPGYPDEACFPWEECREIAHELLSSRRSAVLQYGATRGYRPLLEVVEGLMAERGIPVSHEQLIVTNGSQQGLDLIARVLLDPGDVVIMELPSYTGAISAFRGVGAELIGVPQEADGCDLVALDASVARLRSAGRRVKFVYTVPNFQNPTGLLVGLEKRRRLLEWAGRHDLLIVEDDPYRDLYFPDVSSEAETRAIATDDREGRVIYLSSFSKTLAPGFRVAWLSAAPAVVARIELAKQASDLCTGALAQQMVNQACRRGVLARQLPLLRDHYTRKRDVMVDALTETLGDALTWELPRGGFFLWARLREPIDGDSLLPFAIARSVIYVAGSAFFVTEPPDRSAAQYIRLSFSAPSPERIREGALRLGAAIRDAHRAMTTTAGSLGAHS
ncbi:MAG TPA: PLP-dependent aminotransferase family protein [Vicinamibacterales bacterium]|nr:PLP-dependent aminotransferase family protein [Vicinamibacterales bacterium]